MSLCPGYIKHKRFILGTKRFGSLNRLKILRPEWVDFGKSKNSMKHFYRLFKRTQILIYSSHPFILRLSIDEP